MVSHLLLLLTFDEYMILFLFTKSQRFTFFVNKYTQEEEEHFDFCMYYYFT